jgi:competence protein ComEC
MGMPVTRGVVDLLSNPPERVTGRGVAPRRGLLVTLLPVLLLLASACGFLPGQGPLGGASPPPSGSLSVSFIDVGQGDGVLVQAGSGDYLIDAGRAEEGPNVVDFLRSRGVDDLEGIVVTNPPIS